MTDDTARAENYAADRCVDCGELTTNRIHHEERLSAYHDANVSLAPARPPGLLREAALDAYRAMDAACRWAAGATAGVKTLADAERHTAGYDALLDATVRLGQALGILSEP